MPAKTQIQLKELLDQSFHKYHRLSFIEDDPISIPHRFSKKQDIEISAFWTAMLAWGQRKTIINKATELFELMDNAPYDFIMNHKTADLEPFKKFKHRTFKSEDTTYFIETLQRLYRNYDSLEELFLDSSLEKGMNRFYQTFFLDQPERFRTRKHVAAPLKNSTSKRIVMFLRWMVRQNSEVDFGIWTKIKPSQLFIPFDVHVERVARDLGLLKRKSRDWQTVIELTNNIKKLDGEDPAKYDFSLFGMGVEGVI